MALDLSGCTIGLLTVLRRGENHPAYGFAQWWCRCSCGREVLYAASKLNRNEYKSCGCNRHVRGKASPAWRGHGEVSLKAFNHAKANAARRKIAFGVTIEQCAEVFTGICALTGESIYFGKGSLQTASLDRIDSAQPYVAGNIQWVHKTVNIMKNALGEDEFLTWCQRVVTYKEVKDGKSAMV